MWISRHVYSLVYVLKPCFFSCFAVILDRRIDDPSLLIGARVCARIYARRLAADGKGSSGELPCVYFSSKVRFWFDCKEPRCKTTNPKILTKSVFVVQSTTQVWRKKNTWFQKSKSSFQECLEVCFCKLTSKFCTKSESVIQPQISTKIQFTTLSKFREPALF